MPRARDFFASGSGVVALVFSILGLVFLTVGACLAVVFFANAATDRSMTVGEPRSVVCVMFLSIGTGFAAVGVPLGWRRVASLRRSERLRKYGMPVTGMVTSVERNVSVRLNGRNPWVVRYEYQVGGIAYRGIERTFDVLVGVEQGTQIGVRYDTEDPRRSTLEFKSSEFARGGG